MWWAHASVLKSTAWKAQEKDPDSLRRRGLHFPYLWRLTETDLDIASSDRPGIRRANKTGSTLIFLALMGGAFAYGIGRFPADRSGAWIAGVTASAAGLAATGFVWRNFARLNIRIITIALSTTAILIPAGLFIIRSIYNQFYSRLGIYSDVDISQVALLRLGWPLTVHMTATAAVSGIMWIALYRHRFAQPNNWLLAMLFIVASMLPIAEAVDNASAAGDQVRQGQPVSGAIYSPTMVCVRPIGHEPISIEYHGRPLLAAGQTAHLWKIGTAGTQTLLMDRDAAKAAAGRVEGGKPQAPHVAPIQFVPSSSISVQLCDDSGPR